MSITPPYNFKQVLERAFKPLVNALRVCVVNTVAEPVPVTLVVGTGNTTVEIFNVTCTTAGTEYSQALPTNTKRFLLKARKNSKVTFAYETAATEVLTIESGVSFEDENFYSLQTIYFKCSKADEVIEIVAYT